MQEDILKEQIGLIAANIIKRAVKDFKGENLCNGVCSKEVKQRFKIEAYRWLTSETCKFYCLILDIDYLKILKRLGIRGKGLC